MKNYDFSIGTLFPRVVTTVLFLWTAYGTLSEVDIIPKRPLVIAVTSFIVLCLYTYYRIVIVGPGYPTDFPDLMIHNMQDVEEGLELPPEYLMRRSVTAKRNGRFRLCQTCNCWKPDRCHHCSACGVCVLKMDHHCPWFAGCVGFKNQKYFVQFLVYTSLYAVFVLVVTFLQFYHWFSSEGYRHGSISFTLLSVFLLAIGVSIAMLFFTGFTCYQVTKNQTTIELYGMRRYRRDFELLNGYPPVGNINVFDLGSRLLNWEEVMGGDKPLLEWLFPVETLRSRRCRRTLDEKGLYFNVSKGSLVDDIDLQNRLLRRVTPRSSLDVSSGER